jgi:hypothetical protein
MWLLNYGANEVTGVDGVLSDSKNKGRWGARLRPDVFPKELLIRVSIIYLIVRPETGREIATYQQVWHKHSIV